MTFTRRNIVPILALAACIQAVIILYNGATGYIALHSVGDFLVRLFFGTLFSSPAALAIVLADETIVRRLDRSPLMWEKNFAARASTEAALAAALGALLGAALTVLVDLLMPYKDGLAKNVVNNALITAVVNLLVQAAVEAAMSYGRTQNAHRKAEALEREIARIRFETLKTQLNPHFMFNSLNVLSSLIRQDASRAEAFIDEFASVYRYTLEVIDHPVVELRRELEFARSYLYLLGIRFENAVVTHIDVQEKDLGLLLPPLSVQIVLENAFKHNKASSEAPLAVTIEACGDTLTVRNTLQPKHVRAEESRGVGLANLRKRYAYLGGAEPDFGIRDAEFVARLPLLTPD